MVDWLWVICLFVGMSIAYAAGYALGANKNDCAPTTNAWVNVHRYSIDRQKEVEKYKIDKEHEFNLLMLDKGYYDEDQGDENEMDEEK